MVHSFVIEPQLFITFDHEAELLDKCKDWGLLSEKASKAKAFYYKGNGLNETCDIVGYVDKLTAVIAFSNGQKHCIHPSYLKEMQAASFGQRYTAKADTDSDSDTGAEAVESEAEAVAAEPQDKEMLEPPAEVLDEPPAVEDSSPKAAAKASKPKAKKIELPEEKVRMTATVKSFTTVPNHFSDTDDEVVIYEAVAVAEPELELGEAWSSHSTTLKKLELAVGDKIAFEAKVIAKKLTKHPVPYKINNPSKIEKQE